MEMVIQQAFIDEEAIRLRVFQGHFDLTGPDGGIILPSTWESVIEPGWTVNMHMWPIGS